MKYQFDVKSQKPIKLISSSLESPCVGVYIYKIKRIYFWIVTLRTQYNVHT